jgi:uncharacterized protein (DUF1800 family)
MDIHEDPTVPWRDEDITIGRPEDITQAQSVPVTPHVSTTLTAAQQDTASQPTVTAPKRQGMSRRKLFSIAALGIAGAGVVGATAAYGARTLENAWQASSLGGKTGNAQIGHLLRRAGFGARPDELTTYASYGFNEAVDRLVNYQQVPDDAMEQRLKALNLDLSKAQNQQRWWLLRMVWTQRPLLEKMTLFWHGVLTSSYRKVGGAKSYSRMMVQNQFLRQHAFDTFDNILLGITADPAMLVYLDLTKSRKKAPNENYARELMELFTLGLGNYTQQDVYEGASALTGWHVAGASDTARYVPADHSNLNKTYLGHTGNLDYKDVITILAKHPATPWFISRKLFTFFVYENPSTEDLRPLVDTYVKSNHNMGEVMKTLLLSPQFSSAKAYRSRIKSPTEFVVGTYRALNTGGNGANLPAMTTIMGQELFNPPNVAGWPGDKVSALWLNSGTWMARLNYIDLLLIGSRSQTGLYPPMDLQGVINANHIDTPEHFVDYFASYLFDGVLDPDRRAQFIDYFNSKNPSKSAAQITLTGGKSYSLNQVRGTLYLMLASPEYQLN